MSTRLYGSEASVPQVPTTLLSLLGIANPDTYCGELVIRAASANLGTVYWGDATVSAAANRWGYLVAREAFAVSLTNGQFKTITLFFIGDDPSNKVHITALEY